MGGKAASYGSTKIRLAEAQYTPLIWPCIILALRAYAGRPNRNYRGIVSITVYRASLAPSLAAAAAAAGTRRHC